MSYASLRIGRFSEPGRPYLVTTVTHGRRKVFDDLVAARLLVRVMLRLCQQRQLDSLAWVIMPDHLHWLFVLNGNHDLAHVMNALKGRSARTINRVMRRDGPLWQRAYHDRALRHEDDVLTVARYVVANPLRAGLVTRLGDYPHWDAAWL